MKESIVQVMAREGFIRGHEVMGEGSRKQLAVGLKYVGRKQPVISGLKRVSRPGRRVYCGAKDLLGLRPAMGAALISTPQGVMTERQASEAKLGGEVLCQIW